jgi:hypothetical protein
MRISLIILAVICAVIDFGLCVNSSRISRWEERKRGKDV